LARVKLARMPFGGTECYLCEPTEFLSDGREGGEYGLSRQVRDEEEERRRAMKNLAIVTVVALGLTLPFTATSNAATLTFDMTFEFSGGTQPDGSPPWLSVFIDDGGSAGSVDVTLSAPGLTNPEFVFEWILNLDPALDPNDLVFSAPIKAGSFADPTVATGANAFMADGDGQFDIQVTFANNDGPPTRFGFGDALTYSITGIATLTASSFDFESQMGGGQGSFPAAAHIGATGPNNEDSGWISTPEPGTLALLALGVPFLRRRR